MLGIGGMHRPILKELSVSVLSVLESLVPYIREVELRMKVDLE